MMLLRKHHVLRHADGVRSFRICIPCQVVHCCSGRSIETAFFELLAILKVKNREELLKDRARKVKAAGIRVDDSRATVLDMSINNDFFMAETKGEKKSNSPIVRLKKLPKAGETSEEDDGGVETVMAARADKLHARMGEASFEKWCKERSVADKKIADSGGEFPDLVRALFIDE